MKPIIHSNGNSKESLVKEIREAKQAVDASINKLHEMTVHSRNYYPYWDDGKQFDQDCKEHEGRIERLREVEKELQDYLIFLLTGKSE